MVYTVFVRPSDIRSVGLPGVNDGEHCFKCIDDVFIGPVRDVVFDAIESPDNFRIVSPLCSEDIAD